MEEAPSQHFLSTQLQHIIQTLLLPLPHPLSIHYSPKLVLQVCSSKHSLFTANIQTFYSSPASTRINNPRKNPRLACDWLFVAVLCEWTWLASNVHLGIPIIKYTLIHSFMLDLVYIGISLMKTDTRSYIYHKIAIDYSIVGRLLQM